MKFPNLSSLPALAKLDGKEIGTLKTIGGYALGFGAVGGLIYFGCKTTSTHASNVSKRKQAEKLERTKADEEIRVAQEKAKAEAEKYERMRKADAEYRRFRLENEPEAIVVPLQKPKEQSAADMGIGSSAETYQLVGDLITAGDLVVLYSYRGCGKSTLATQIAIEIAAGEPTLLFPDDAEAQKKQQVLYYDGERDDADRKEILGEKDMTAYRKLEFFTDFYFTNCSEWLADLRQHLASCTGDVTVVLDNITCICSTVSAEMIRKLLLNDLKGIKNEYKERVGGVITFIIIAHTNKQMDLAGSINLSNFATTVIGLAPYDDSHIKMTIDKNRKHGELQDKVFLLQKVKDEDGWKHFKFESALEENEQDETTQDKREQEKAVRRKRYEEVAILLSEKKPWVEITAKTGISKQRFQNWKKEFVEVKPAE